ncbi:protocadherin gamma subfamily A, 11 isoform X32 [Xenopus tropicalis]|uniref:Protocadherin gamma subfamily A, 11 isoform X32 n=1 Tax=Xenopus tropicalis TaxID=8364 RepID=A0A8J1J7R2_XENTR|nr:protocadherin gamma subfamily A, 11 isoform X32 [Xenopus tropicalis]
MDFQSPGKDWKWQVVYFYFLYSWGWVSGQLRYSIAEESEPGTLVGNVAQDLGLNLADIEKRRLSLKSGANGRYFIVDQKTGALTVRDRIDRESLCGSSLSCLLPLELGIEKPFELFSVDIEILDINDNSPSFSSDDQIIKMTEIFANPGVRFPLDTAEDSDVGINGISQYKINPNPFFSLSVKNRKDGTLIAELVLEKKLDREEKGQHELLLTAFDGGEQPRSGSTQITIIILDVNDNAPVFDQPSYKINLLENLPLRTVVMKLNATDLDEGVNAEISYFFDHHTSTAAKQVFDLNPETGEIFIKRLVDFEESHFYELYIKAIDGGTPQLEGRCLVHVEVEDINDNSPEIIFTSNTNEVPEDAPIGTVVGFITVRDKDSGKNGEVQLDVSSNLPFKIKFFKSRYSLVTSEHLDREKTSQYTIQVTASDLGSPALSNRTVIVLNVSDVNDNCPVFSQSVYNAHIKENNEPGTLLCTVSATDPDVGSNSDLKYSISESQIDGSSVSSFVYINSNTGDIYAQRSFDYELFQVLTITARVEDSGSPKLFSNVSVHIFILDTNDNAPSVLYPGDSKGFIAQEKIPQSASAGYLVSKISAIDPDSGHNAWLSYRIVEPIGQTIFEISKYTGEIRAVRSFFEMDTTEQHLVISVSDHGEPALSATVTVIINSVDKIAQELPHSQDLIPNSQTSPNLTLYLIISLVAISLVSLITFLILLVKCLKRDNYGSSCGFCFSSKYQTTHYTDQYKPTLYLNTDGTLKYMEVRMVPPESQEQCYQACFPSASENNDITSMRTMNFPQQAQPNADWRFSQAAQKPGPSGAQPTEEAGVWPNNQFETERLQAMILASANEAAEGTSGLGGGTGTMGLSARYGPQFTLQHVPDYRQNVYIPGSTLTPTNGAGKREGKGNKKKSSKKDKK